MSGEVKCCASIFENYRRYPCGKKAKVERAGKMYCGIHDPDRLKAIRAKSEARWDEEARLRHLVYIKEEAGREVVRLACAAVRQAASWDDVAAAVARLEAMDAPPLTPPPSP